MQTVGTSDSAGTERCVQYLDTRNHACARITQPYIENNCMTTAMSLHDGHVQMARTWKTLILALSCKHHTGARPPCKLLPPQSVCTAPFCTKEQATTCNAAPTNTNSCAHAMHAKATHAAANPAPAGNTAHRSVGLDAQAVWGERLTTSRSVGGAKGAPPAAGLDAQARVGRKAHHTKSC